MVDNELPSAPGRCVRPRAGTGYLITAVSGLPRRQDGKQGEGSFSVWNKHSFPSDAGLGSGSCREVGFLPGGGSRTQAWSAPQAPESPGFGAALASGTEPPGVIHARLLGGTRGPVSVHSTASVRELDWSRKAWASALKLSLGKWALARLRARGPPSGAAGDGGRGSPRGPHAGHAATSCSEWTSGPGPGSQRGCPGRVLPGLASRRGPEAAPCRRSPEIPGPPGRGQRWF